MKPNSQINQCQRMKLKKNQLKKETKNQLKSTWVNLSKLHPRLCNWDNSIENKS
jgi:hypothetical protein